MRPISSSFPCSSKSFFCVMYFWFLATPKSTSSSVFSASAISGGESFLVSLALALGLSSLNRKSLSVDVLFIDEGFGTLDSDYLNTVMESLEKLHQIGGKKVGIISHVEALRERIATQIHVERVNHTLSRVEVVSRE